MSAGAILAFRNVYAPRAAVCAQCGASYLKRCAVHVYCSDRCARIARYGVHVCPACGAEFVPSGWASTHTHTCSRLCARELCRQERARVLA